MLVGWTARGQEPIDDYRLSKSMTATAIMPLTNRFSVDDAVVTVLPEFKMADPRYTKITARSSS